MSFTSTDRDKPFAYDQEAATAQFARRLKRHLQFINILLVVNAIAWGAAIAMLIRYFCQ